MISSSLASSSASCTSITNDTIVNLDAKAEKINIRRKPLEISREQRNRIVLSDPLLSVQQRHESTPQQMLLLIRQLPDTLSTFESLRHWVYGPPATALNLELVNRLRDADDDEAEFLLKSISQANPETSEYRQQLCSAKRELCPYATITTEEGETYPVKALLDPGCTDSVIS